MSSATKLAESLALLGTSSLAGAILSFSAFGIPTVAAHAAGRGATATASQWRTLFTLGARTIPPLAIATAAAVAVLAARSYEPDAPLAAQPRRFGLLVAAAALVPSIVPYTLVAMARVNGALLRVAAGAGAKGGVDEVLGLMGRWRLLNVGRASLMGVAAVCVIAAVVWN